MFSGASLASEWEIVSKAGQTGFDIQIKKDSLEVLSVGGVLHAQMIMRVRSASDNAVDFEKLRVRQSDCVRGYGRVERLSLSDKTISLLDFLLDGGNNTSHAVNFICTQAWDYEIAKLVADVVGDLDYIGNTSAVRAFDENLERVKAQPESKAQTIRWLVRETHRITIGK